MPRTQSVETLSKEILVEMKAMQDIGMTVPAKALLMAEDLSVVSQYLSSDLKMSDLADLFCDLSS